MFATLRALFARWFRSSPVEIQTDHGPLEREPETEDEVDEGNVVLSSTIAITGADAGHDQPDTGTPDILVSPVVIDGNLIEKARAQWQFGDWEALAGLDRKEIQNHPDAAKLALLAAAGHLQLGHVEDAQELIAIAQGAGCGKRLAAQVLVSGVYNSLARASTLAGNQARAMQHFDSAIAAVELEEQLQWVTKGRASKQLNQLGLTRNAPELRPSPPELPDLSVPPDDLLEYLPQCPEPLDPRLRFRLSELAIARLSVLKSRKILLEVSGPDATESQPLISVIVAAGRFEQLQNIIRNVSCQTYKDKELIIVPHHFTEAQKEALRELLKPEELGVTDIKILDLDDSMVLGARLNRAIAASAGTYWAKMDDDDLYLENYLSDMMIPFSLGDCDVVGKCEQFVFHESIGKMILKKPGCSNVPMLVSGATLVVKRSPNNELFFGETERGEDTALMKEAKARGMKIYAADPFNHVLMRYDDLEKHTWKVGVNYFLRLGQVVADRLDLDLVRL